MKIAIVADCHLNKAFFKGVMDKDNPTIPFRMVDHMKAFSWIVDDSIEKSVSLMVIAGDIFDTFNPSNEVRAFFFKEVRKLKDAKIPVIIMTGNHDVCGRHHPLQGVGELAGGNVKVIDSPKTLVFNDHALLLFPHPMDVERKKKTMREAFHEFVEEIHGKEAEFENKELLFFGHFPVQGAVMNRFLSPAKEEFTKISRPIVNSDAESLTPAELDEIGAPYIFLGDFHQHQRVKTKKSVTMYTGSIEKSNLSELSQAKGYLIYDSELEHNKKMGKAKFVEYPNCRPMIDLKGNYKEIEAAYSLHSESPEGAIVRIFFHGDQNELREFSQSIDGLKARIIGEIAPIHLYQNSKLVNEEEDRKSLEIGASISEDGHTDETVVIEVIESMIKAILSNEKECEIVVGMAEDIYTETMETV